MLSTRLKYCIKIDLGEDEVPKKMDLLTHSQESLKADATMGFKKIVFTDTLA